MELLLNEDLILKNHKILEEYNGYIPMILYDYIDNFKYFENVKKNKKILDNISKHRNELLSSSDFGDYLYNDLEKWIENNPSFDFIISKE